MLVSLIQNGIVGSFGKQHAISINHLYAIPNLGIAKMPDQQKKTIIVSLNNDVSEIVQLADTLGYHAVKTFIQQRKIPDVNSYLGQGKVDEIKAFIDTVQEDIDLVIVNGELRPSQWFVLEKQLKRTVYDRIRLILGIFEQRAERKEARLQVKLAQLHYERPFVRELIHRTRAGEHPGFMAGGEYQVDDYYEMIKKQMKKIRGELDKIREDRELHRHVRYKSGFYLLSLAGYTNAGKSSLLNLLAGEQVRVEGKLFSTLSTTTRKIDKTNHGKTVPILLTDTVGFIQNLPSWIIDAFHSTLEEIAVADVVVLVADGSEEHEVLEKKVQVSLDELREIGVTASVLIVVNKIDLLSEEEVETKLQYLSEKGVLQSKTCVPISAKEHRNIDVLFDAIYASLPNLVTLKLWLPMTKEAQAFVSKLYDTTRVIDVSYTDHITIDIECNAKIKEKIIASCQALNGSIC